MDQSTQGILLVSEIYPPAIGGSGVLLENLYSRLGDMNVQVLTHGDEPSRVQRGLSVHSVAMQAPDWGLLRPASLRRHVRVAGAVKRLRQHAPLTIHCARALPEGLSARLALFRQTAPYICWLHGEELGYASTSRELQMLARRVYRGASAVIANSNNSKQLLVSGWGVPDSRVHVIHPGVDTERFQPDVDGRALRARAASDRDVLFLSVGRLQRRKGHDMVLRALAEVRRTVPHVRYAIVGDGPHLSTLEAEAAQLGVSDIVHFAGLTNEAQLPAWYAACDVFVMPNRSDGVDFEGFGIVFLEAAAAAKPVVGGRSGGVPEAVEDGATGWLVDGESTAELVAVMARLASSPNERRRLGEAGRQRVLRSFTWDEGARRLAAVHALAR